jgi:2-keto-4-pentenoate hydratase/2-oxohepta-3-ene-1,7-dioic acid hydratase in catechol pathway
MRQMASTRDMIFTVRQLIAFVSSVMTFQPGDILMTGSPAGVSRLLPGDTVEISIEGLGTLSNPVVASQSP